MDQVGEVEKRIRSLGGILTCPIGYQDCEEKARREDLRRFVLPIHEVLVHNLIVCSACRKLAGIIAELEPLSEQHGVSKFLNNVEHANILNGFIQDLAYAVTDYQVSDPDSIRWIGLTFRIDFSATKHPQ